jgi:hypothetical protein
MFEYSYRAFVHRKKTELDASVIQSGDAGMQAMRITDGGMPIAARSVIGYARLISMSRLVAVMCLFAVSLGLAGCTKCGWLWDEGPRSCRSDSPR